MVATLTTELPRKKRRPTSLFLVIICFALICLYVASIGPLAGLEARGYGNQRFWYGIKPAYYPLFWSWKHGPEWWANSLGYYTRLFHAPKPCSWSIQAYEFGSSNDAEVYRNLRK